MTLLIDDRENDRVAHKILIKLGDASGGGGGDALIRRLKIGDYVFGDWGVEAKEINDLYNSILGRGRSRTVNGQLSELADTFKTPIVVVYGSKWKPFVPGGKPTRKSIAIQIQRMEATVKGWKQTFHQQHPRVRFMQLNTEDEFVDWIVAQYRQRKISKSIGNIPIGVKQSLAQTRQQLAIVRSDPRIQVLTGMDGINTRVAKDLLSKFGSIPKLLQSGVTQKSLMEIKGVSRNKARKILELREGWKDE